MAPSTRVSSLGLGLRRAAILAVAALSLALPAPTPADDLFSVSPHVAAGGAWTDVGGGGGVEVGARMGPFLVAGSWRQFGGAERHVTWVGGRADYFLLRTERLGLRAGLGAGAFRHVATDASATAAGVSAGVGLILWDREGFNLLGLGAEVVAHRSPGGPLPAAPTVLVTIDVNLLYLYALKG